jgi:hypothetical protein
MRISSDQIGDDIKMSPDWVIKLLQTLVSRIQSSQEILVNNKLHSQDIQEDLFIGPEEEVLIKNKLQIK